MKVLWLSHLLPYPPKIGVALRAYHLIKELSKYADVHVLAFNQRDLMRSFYHDEAAGLAEARSKLEAFCRVLDVLPLPTDRGRFARYWIALKSVFTKAPYNINWTSSPQFRDALSKALSDNDYDLVHLDTISFVAYADLLVGHKVAIDHHNIESHMLLRRAGQEHHALKAWYFRQEGRRLAKYEQAHCAQAALNVTCSDEDSRRLREIVPQAKCEAVPNGVDLARYTQLDIGGGEANRFAFLGALGWYPNAAAAHYIAEQWPSVRAAVPGAVVDIIGGGAPEKLKQFAQREASYKVHGFVDDLNPLMRGAGIFLCPITDGGGTKLKLLEAFALGKAVLAHPIGCEGINVEHGKNVWLAQTDAEFVEACRLLSSDAELRRKLGAGGRALVEAEYGFEAIGKKLADAYQSISSC